jgi:hypothetical protein
MPCFEPVTCWSVKYVITQEVYIKARLSYQLDPCDARLESIFCAKKVECRFLFL